MSSTQSFIEAHKSTNHQELTYFFATYLFSLQHLVINFLANLFLWGLNNLPLETNEESNMANAFVTYIKTFWHSWGLFLIPAIFSFILTLDVGEENVRAMRLV